MHHAGADRAHPDAAAGQLAGEALGQHEHRCLGGRVGRQGRGGEEPGHRRGDHDVAALAAVHHGRQERAQRVDHAPQVDVEHPTPVLLGGVQERAAHPDAGVGHDHIRDAVLGGHLIRQDSGGRRVGDVEPVGQAGRAVRGDLGGGAFGGRGVDVHAQQVRALLGEGQRAGPADAAAGAGDQDQLSVHRAAWLADPGPGQLAAGRTALDVVDELGDGPGHRAGLGTDRPVPGDQFPPPEAGRAPGVGGVQQRRGAVLILS